MESKYIVEHTTVQQLLSKLQGQEIVIPDIQRPFVWDGARVRDFIDSLYRGYPVGYIVSSQSQNVRLKDGTVSKIGSELLIDGQQRITALATSLLGWSITNKDYEKKVIRIAFNPTTEEFKVSDASTAIDKVWIDDISVFFAQPDQIDKWWEQYCEQNQVASMAKGMGIIAAFNAIKSREIGLVRLKADTSLEDVTTIFNRINSQGIRLKDVDFVMSKIAADKSHGGDMMRRCIDHFCELVVRPDRYSAISENDKDFTSSEYHSKLSWLRNEYDDIYDPSYENMVRVIFTYKFQRGKISDLVQLVSGRNFATRSYEDDVVNDTFTRLKDGLLDYMNETNFKNFVMIISSAGFCRGKMIRSMGAMDFAYSMYLYLRSVNYPSNKLQDVTRRWFVMSLLTGRYGGSSETQYEKDIKAIVERGIEDYLFEIERIELSDNFWNDRLVLDLKTSSSTNAAYNVYLASQVRNNSRGFLSTSITVKNMIEEKGDIHHIFPKAYLKDEGLTLSQYNQVANYAYVQTEINIRIGKKSPKEYFDYVVNHQCNGDEAKYGGITSQKDLTKNMVENSIPDGLETMTASNYFEFLERRRVLMASAIHEYYKSL